MLLSPALLLLLLLVLLVTIQAWRALSVCYGIALGAALALLLVGTWSLLDWAARNEPPPPEDQTASRPVTSERCFKCHESHYRTWQRTFHRTMTREATPENVKADFNNATHRYRGVTSHLTREGDRYYLDTIDPGWEEHITEHGIPRDKAGPAPRRTLSVDRLVGSHWFQQLLHRDPFGRYIRLPLAYHLVEKRWIHINGAFLGGETASFFGKSGIWNETCVYCHNTRPSKNPEPVPGQPPGYNTEVGELGISCEACHGAGDRHVRAHQNPARRVVVRDSGEGDPTIINPARLPVDRADDICARCHGGTMPRLKEWDRQTFADPFLAGRDLKRFWYRPFSEAEQHLRLRGQDDLPSPPPPGPLDGRFWGDGTPLTTALEYQGLALSACYENGRGKLSCLTCHSMHDSDPNHQVKAGHRSNEACYSCHPTYRGRLAEHTHHPAGSAGSLCYNCHMPHQVYSLLDTHRSHRISVPRIRDSRGTGKPHACNLCHLDKSLGWTSAHLQKWYGTRPGPLSEDERTLASSLLHLTRGDARSRAVVAGAFGWPAAQQASGKDWAVPLLLQMLERERYEAVRYTLHRALRSLCGPAADDYNYQGEPGEREAQVRRLRRAVGAGPPVAPSRYPNLPLTPDGRLAEGEIDRLLRARTDPDVKINE